METALNGPLADNISSRLNDQIAKYFKPIKIYDDAVVMDYTLAKPVIVREDATVEMDIQIIP